MEMDKTLPKMAITPRSSMTSIWKDWPNLSKMTTKAKSFMEVKLTKVKDSSPQQLSKSQAKTQPWCRNKFLAPLCQSSLTQTLTRLLKKSTTETSLWWFIISHKIRAKLIRSKTKQAQGLLWSMTQWLKCWIFIYLLAVLEKVGMEGSMENQAWKHSATQRVSARPKP